MQKAELKSMDVAEDKRWQLAQLFPEVVTETRTPDGKLTRAVDFEKLKAVLGMFSEVLENQKERYGMTWPGKNECLKIIQQPSIATLKPCREESVNFDTTENLFIEGDNLEVLKLLQKAYYGKVKMIYIDPPYNTGKEFIYPDNYSETLDTYLAYTGQVDAEGRKFSTNTEAEGRFHSKWLNMMLPRLYLARNLLREDGVIFISIDDNELENLKSLCCELFGEENFVGCVIWQHSLQPKGYTGKFSVHHNYLLCFRKSECFDLESLERTEEHNKNYSNPDNDPNGPWRTGDVRNALFRPNLIYDISTPSGKIIKAPANGWRWSRETTAQKIQTGEIVFSDDETRIIRKIYLKNVEGRTPETIWFGKNVGTTRDAANELKELFDGNSPFDTPKPIGVVTQMLQLATYNTDCIILDFFSGSCTTAHAALDLNKQDGGNRKFIMVQLPEPCDEKSEAFKAGYKTIAGIGKERIRRVIKKLEENQPRMDANKRESEQGHLFPNSEISVHSHSLAVPPGFKVFKLDRSNFKVWDSEKIVKGGCVMDDGKENQPSTIKNQTSQIIHQLELHEQHIDPNAGQEDILYELLLKAGFPLTTKVEKVQMAGKDVFSVADGALLICLEREITKELIKAMADADPLQVICLDEGFKANDQLKANAVQTFKARSQGKESATVFRTV